MSNAERTKLLGKYLDGLLGTFQYYIQDDLIVSIARLTDRDSKRQKNLTLWSLVDRCEKWNASVAHDVRAAVEALATEVEYIRIHRHKRLAHFDLSVSIGQSELPVVTFKRLFAAIESIEAILNLVSKAAVNSTLMYSILDHRDVVGAAEITAYKAAAYDAAELAGQVERRAWRNYSPK